MIPDDGYWQRLERRIERQLERVERLEARKAATRAQWMRWGATLAGLAIAFGLIWAVAS